MKDLDQINIMAKAEMGFLKMIVQPLWTLLNTFLDNELEDLIKRLCQNAEEWEKIYEIGNDPEKKSFLLKILKDDALSEDNSSSKDEEIPNVTKRPKSMLSSFKTKFLKKKE